MFLVLFGVEESFHPVFFWTTHAGMARVFPNGSFTKPRDLERVIRAREATYSRYDEAGI
jgi:hypothetical protein